MIKPKTGLGILIISVLALILSACSQAQIFVPLEQSADSKSTGSRQAYISQQVWVDDKALQSVSLLDNQSVRIRFQLHIAPTDQGAVSNLHLLAWYNGQAFVNRQGNWQPYQQGTPLPGYQTTTLSASQTIELTASALPAGEYLFYAGYQNRQGEILYNRMPVQFMVYAAGQSGLRRVQQPDFLANLLLQAQQNPQTDIMMVDTAVVGIDGKEAASTASATSDSDSNGATDAAAATSGTNLQEAGVDEADRVKTWQDKLYAIDSCEQILNKQADYFIPGSTQNYCLQTWQLQETPAQATQLDSISLSGILSAPQIYLDTQENDLSLLVLSSSFTQNLWSSWYYPSYWQNQKVQLQWFRVDQQGLPSRQQQISLDGAYVSSHKVGHTLYLLSRFAPEISVPEPPYPVIMDDGDKPADSGQAVTTARQQKKTQDSTQFLPQININGQQHALVTANDCYIAMQATTQYPSANLMVLSAIPLDAPEQYQSICISGNIETFYMSQQALYLASSRMDYERQGNTLIYPPDGDYQTEIHKFAFAGTQLQYKGSAQIPGHLGWEQDKQSFRFGENQGFLKVATSLGDTWNKTSRTRVSVLTEDTQSQSLTEIAYLDHLGKTGEKLYAARFIGKYGYLVTFRKTDPLYILDFSDPYQPKVAGELYTNGYSDYLHPIGEHYLLGLGKDAVSTADADNAWYQGLKLSLFDLSDPTNPQEVNKVIIGKRGTSSNALIDHHAFSSLNLASGQTRIVFPVSLHETEPQNSYYSADDPRKYYQFTHNALYVFDFTGTDQANPQLQYKGKLIVNDDHTQDTYNDRGIIQGDSLHYWHNGDILSALAEDLSL